MRMLRYTYSTASQEIVGKPEARECNYCASMLLSSRSPTMPRPRSPRSEIPPSRADRSQAAYWADRRYPRTDAGIRALRSEGGTEIGKDVGALRIEAGGRPAVAVNADLAGDEQELRCLDPRDMRILPE